MTAAAWVLASVFFAGFLLALHVGEEFATSVGPYLAAGLFIAWVWLAYHYDRRTG